MTKIKMITKGIYGLLFLALITSATFILLTTYNIIPNHNFYTVLSGSMEPAIATGSVIAVRQEDSYKVNDIVTVAFGENSSETFTHRIVEKEEESETTYITKGDANESPDSTPVSENAIIGKTFLTIPLLGYIVNFAQQPLGLVLMIVIPSLIIITSEMNNIKEELYKLIKSKKEK